MAFQYDLAGTDFDEIRQLISPELDTNSLPNAVMNYSVYAGEALSRLNFAISALTPDQITAAEDDLKRAYLTIIAGLIAPNVRQITRENIEGDDMYWSTLDMGKLSASLLASGADILNRIILAVVPGATNGITDVFSTAGSNLRRRGYQTLFERR